jgi:hypothetical protein
MAERRTPVHRLMSEREGEGAVCGSVLFRNLRSAEPFIDWKLRQGCTVRLWHDQDIHRPLTVEFEP